MVQSVMFVSQSAIQWAMPFAMHAPISNEGSSIALWTFGGFGGHLVGGHRLDSGSCHPIHLFNRNIFAVSIGIQN